MPRSLRYDEPYLLDERVASPIRHSGIRWGIGLVRFRRDLGIRLGVREGRQSTHCSRFLHDTGWTAVDPNRTPQSYKKLTG